MKKISFYPLLLVAIFVGFIGLMFYAVKSSPSAPSYEEMTSRELAQLCLPMEGQAMHIHTNLKIIADKQTIPLPANIGIDASRNCMTSLHTHDADGIIHVEAPAVKYFTLGDFFAVWGKPLNENQMGDYKVDADHGLMLSVDGQPSTAFENLLLKDGQQIVINYYNLKDSADPLLN